MGEGAGDLFSLAWSSELQTIFVGCQNTSLQWFDFRDPISRLSSPSSVVDGSTLTSSTYTPKVGASRKAHKFFDSYPQYERKPADIHANNEWSGLRGRSSPDSDRSNTPPPQDYLSIPAYNVIDSAHYGYIYCMVVLRRGGQTTQLATGSGDETVKVLMLSLFY
jgi:di- and tripeptidase